MTVQGVFVFLIIKTEANVSQESHKMPFNPNVQKKLLGHKVKDVLVADQLTNRELREKSLLSLARKFKPHLAKSLKTMIFLSEDQSVPASVRYQASKFVIEFHKSLVNDLYKDKYDEEGGEEIQSEPAAPVFSLKMVTKEPEKVAVHQDE